MLKSYSINCGNYRESVEQLRTVANAKENVAESMVLRKNATKIERFFNSTPTEKEINAFNIFGKRIDKKSVIVYFDTLDGSVEYEYMLIADDGTHYEKNELNLNNFPLLTEDEIYSKAEEVRLSRNEYSESGDYWESMEAEEDCGVW